MSLMYDQRQRIGRRILAAALGFTMAAVATTGALRIGVIAARALQVDVHGQSAVPAIFLHVLLACAAPVLLWLAVACAAAGCDIVRTVSCASEPRTKSVQHRSAGRRHAAAILLAVTGAGALGALPSAPASASPLPPGTTQSAPRSSAMDVPVPTTTSTAPTAEPTTSDVPDVPQPGWVTPAPSPTSQRCATGARLIAGCPSREDPAQVVVHRGDSLWSLISRHLHTHDPAVIAAALPQWYAANEAVIGPDPDLLRVGERLHIPAVTPVAHTTQGE